MEKKTVSIIIPVYNVEDYILECLSSISAQTFEGNIECILVDDCSSDKSLDLIRKFIDDDKSKVEYHVILQEKNQRQGIARNVGIKNAKGEYILFVDSDDVISPHCLEVMFCEIEKHPNADYVLCSMIDMDGNISFAPIGYPSFVSNKKWLMSKSLFSEGGIPPGPVNKLIRKSLILDNNIFFPGDVIFEDVQFSFLLGIYAKSACFCMENTYFYRTNREGSTITTTAKNMEFGLKSRIILMHNMIDLTICENKRLQFDSLFAKFLLYIKINENVMSNQFEMKLSEVKSHFIKKAPVSLGLVLASLPLPLLRNKYFNRMAYKILWLVHR